jgi:hypothetical protein
MFHNEYLGNETLTREYKEFTFNHGGLEFDPIVAEDLIKSSKWIFNDLIKDNIQKYLRIYLPKYVVGFMDSLSEASSGELYIGVNDAGVVQGIPFQGFLSEEMIRDEIKSVINEYVICDTKQKKILMESINIELVPIVYIENELSPTHDLLIKYYTGKADYDAKEQAFAKEFSTWYSQFTIYMTKLVDLFNLEPTRTELYHYIQKKKPDSNVLKMMDDGYQLETRTHEEITVLKDDITNPYYWVCEWKDLMIDSLKLVKPIPRHRSDIVPLFNPMHIITKLNCMIPWWMQKNEGMNLYLIKITFKKHQDINEIYYLDTFNKLNRCYRTIVDGNPCCMPV